MVRAEFGVGDGLGLRLHLLRLRLGRAGTTSTVRGRPRRRIDLGGRRSVCLRSAPRRPRSPQPASGLSGAYRLGLRVYGIRAFLACLFRHRSTSSLRCECVLTAARTGALHGVGRGTVAPGGPGLKHCGCRGRAGVAARASCVSWAPWRPSPLPVPPRLWAAAAAGLRLRSIAPRSRLFPRLRCAGRSSTPSRGTAPGTGALARDLAPIKPATDRTYWPT